MKIQIMGGKITENLGSERSNFICPIPALFIFKFSIKICISLLLIVFEYLVYKSAINKNKHFNMFYLISKLKNNIRSPPLDISDGHGFYKSWHVKVKIGLDCCTWSFHITFLSSCFIAEKKCTRSATIFQLMAVSLGQSNFRIISWFCQLHAMQTKSISEQKEIFTNSPFSLFFFLHYENKSTKLV